MMNGKKIAKSDGNVAFMDEVIERWFSGEDVRYFFLQAHYRSFQDFTWEGLEAASKARKKLKSKIQQTSRKINKSSFIKPSELDLKSELWRKIMDYLSDDFDTVKTIALLHEYDFSELQTVIDLMSIDDLVLKLWLFDEEDVVEVPKEVAQLAEKRWQAKSEKNRSLADELRDEITALGWTMLDGKEGYELQKI